MNIKGIIAIALVAVFVFAAGFYIPKFLQSWDINVSVKKKAQVQTQTSTYDVQALAQQVVPAEGVKLGVKFGDIGPKLIQSGTIDLEKFKAIYQGANALTDEQLEILTLGRDQEITVNAGNAHFLLNLFWALGLANKNKILDEGVMVEGGRAKVGNFASTGGWTVSKTKAVNYYSKFQIIPISADQQKIVEEVANGVFRPCCNNSTAFPDCNHGMAALGLAELMVSQGATPDQIFDALKAMNSYWFSNQYIELAGYFEAKVVTAWKDVPARTVLGREYSSSSGWKKVHDWLSANNFLPPATNVGSSCGV